MKGEKAMLNDNENVQMNMTEDEPSMLHENMLLDSTIQTVMGHTDITTTQKFYIKNRMSDDQISNQMKQVNI